MTQDIFARRQQKYFRGRHMNKQSWMTLRLDDTLSDDELFTRLEQSYRLANKKIFEVIK